MQGILRESRFGGRLVESPRPRREEGGGAGAWARAAVREWGRTCALGWPFGPRAGPPGRGARPAHWKREEQAGRSWAGPKAGRSFLSFYF